MSSEPLSAQNLLSRCNDLLCELRALQTCLDERRENGAKDIRNFINQAQSERRSLEKVSDQLTNTVTITTYLLSYVSR